IRDVEVDLDIIRALGKKVEFTAPNTLEIHSSGPLTTEVPRHLGCQSRAAILTLGPLLARFGKAIVPLPGGCKIGNRPVDRHLAAVKALGAEVILDKEVYQATTPQLRGGIIAFPKKTVMGTETALLASVLAPGETEIINAAAEPEVDDLIGMLRGMWAQVSRDREDSARIKVSGVERLGGIKHRLIPDRNEAVTFAISAAVTRGDVVLKDVRPGDLTAFLAKLDAVGVSYEVAKDSLHIWANPDQLFQPTTIETKPHPGFMTDWQQPFCVLLTQADGESIIHETVHNQRLGYTKELNRMGAKITLFNPEVDLSVYNFNAADYDLKHFHAARVLGPTSLRSTRMEIPDLRAGATLVIAALAATGKSEIFGVEHIDRGYENFEEKLKGLGAQIERV
ncbi:UDP-N-acetylglucosamine 1-carboxyvinyltransferase, partial [Candidatus Parcubacteria bacterium]|nr:UDP-N-acetylglucosamine 1-carboxyvinyltransferase [Candidatus Parcubacteria bacterium]